jgi:hypothetical protein
MRERDRLVVRRADVLYGKILMTACIGGGARAIALCRKWGFEEVGSHEFVVGSDAQADVIVERRI